MIKKEEEGKNVRNVKVQETRRGQTTVEAVLGLGQRSSTPDYRRNPHLVTGIPQAHRGW